MGINCAECHGTGTALGDPIECGALRGVMKSTRKFPLTITSSKSNIAHLEAAAGSAGLTKCIMMISSAVSLPNVHAKALNPSLDLQGYPCLLESESVDNGCSATCLGVS